MKQYLDVIKLKFIYSLQYRSQVYAGILTQVFFGLVYIMVYLAFYESGDNYPMALKDLIAGTWCPWHRQIYESCDVTSFFYCVVSALFL